MNSVPPFSQNRGDIKYIRFEILQIMSPPEDVKFSNVRGLYLRKYGIRGNMGIKKTEAFSNSLSRLYCRLDRNSKFEQETQDKMYLSFI